MKSRKNPYAKLLKKQVTIRLGMDVITYFKELAEETGIPYQVLIDQYLRDCALTGRKQKTKWVSPRRTPRPRELGPGQTRKRQTILHSDRRCQFTSDAYQRFLKDQNIVSSMSRVGSCADNAAAEGFFGRLKRERVNRRRYFTVSSARANVFDYIERDHNPEKAKKTRTAQVERNTLNLVVQFIEENPREHSTA